MPQVGSLTKVTEVEDRPELNHIKNLVGVYIQGPTIGLPFYFAYLDNTNNARAVITSPVVDIYVGKERGLTQVITHNSIYELRDL